VAGQDAVVEVVVVVVGLDGRDLQGRGGGGQLAPSDFLMHLPGTAAPVVLLLCSCCRCGCACCSSSCCCCSCCSDCLRSLPLPLPLPLRLLQLLVDALPEPPPKRAPAAPAPTPKTHRNLAQPLDHAATDPAWDDDAHGEAVVGRQPPAGKPGGSCRSAPTRRSTDAPPCPRKRHRRCSTTTASGGRCCRRCWLLLPLPGLRRFHTKVCAPTNSLPPQKQPSALSK